MQQKSSGGFLGWLIIKIYKNKVYKIYILD